MPLVSRMLIAERGTRGAPRPIVPRRRIGPAPHTEFQRAVRTTLTQFPIEHAELGLPLLCGQFADVLLDPQVERRTDFPSIAPQAAVEILLELARQQRRWRDSVPELQDDLARIAQGVHLATNRYLCSRRETHAWIRLAEPNAEPARWLPGELRHDVVSNVLLDVLRSAVLLELDRSLRRPLEIRVRADGGSVELVALGCIRYTFDRECHVTRVRALDGDGRFEPVKGSAIRPLAPLGSWHWVDRFVNRHASLIRAVAGALIDEEDDLGRQRLQLGQWLASSVRTRVRRSGCLHALRRAIRAAMPYPRDVRKIACRIRRDPRTPVTSIEFDRVEQHLDGFRAILQANPRLLHLAALFPRPDATLGPPDPQQLKKLLRDNELSKNAWRLLCRYGERVYAPAIGGWWFNQDRWHAVVAIANLIVACQRQGLPAPELLRHLVQVDDQNPDHDQSLAPPRLFRAAWDAAGTLSGQRARQAFADGAFARAVAWWWAQGDELQVPRGARWAWFDAAATAWQARERIARRDAGTWSCPLETFDAGAIRVVPLCSAVDLWDEGQALRHCVWMDSFVQACRNGLMQVFSLRDAHTGKRLATAAFTRHPGAPFEHSQLGGFANQESERADVEHAADATLIALQRLAAERPPPRLTDTNDGARAA